MLNGTLRKLEFTYRELGDGLGAYASRLTARDPYGKVNEEATLARELEKRLYAVEGRVQPLRFIRETQGAIGSLVREGRIRSVAPRGETYARLAREAGYPSLAAAVENTSGTSGFS